MRTSGQQSQQKKQRLEGIDIYQLRTEKGDSNDILIIWNYAALLWSTHASDSNIGKIQRTENGALKIMTDSHE